MSGLFYCQAPSDTTRSRCQDVTKVERAQRRGEEEERSSHRRQGIKRREEYIYHEGGAAKKARHRDTPTPIQKPRPYTGAGLRGSGSREWRTRISGTELVCTKFSPKAKLVRGRDATRGGTVLVSFDDGWVGSRTSAA